MRSPNAPNTNAATATRRSVRLALLIHRFNAEQRPLILRRQHIQETVRPLTDVSDALLQVDQHGFAPKFLPSVIEFDPLNLAGLWDAAFTQAADEHVPFPVREAIARVERHARQADGWQPHNGRVLEAILRRPLRD